jgi:hypothetical protein
MSDSNLILPATHVGFIYHWEHIRNGEVIDRWSVPNIMPTVGLNYMADAAFGTATKISTWYVGLFTASGYTPALADTMATIISTATEFTGYSGATRLTFTPDTVAAGVVQNSVSPAAFTITAAGPTSIYGAFMSSIATQGSSSGTLASSVKFSTAKSVVATDILRVIAGATLTSS